MSTKTFNDLIQVLSYGKLSNLAIFGEGTGNVPVETHPRLIAALNVARTDLFTRFRLRQRELTVLADSSRATYYLRPEHAINSGVVSADKYLVDDINDPFLGGLARIERVIGPTGIDYSVGDTNYQDTSVTFTGHDALVLAHPNTGDAYRVEYRAAPLHVPLDYDLATDGDFELDIPDPYWTPFLSRIAAEVFTAMGNQETLARATVMQNEWEAACLELKHYNTDLADQSVTNVRFDLGGWR